MKMLFVPEKDKVMLDLAARIRMPVSIYRLCIWPLLVYRRLKYGYCFLRIPLTRGQYAIVDVKDYDKLARYNWYVSRKDRGYYAVRTVTERDGQGKGKTMRMHRQIMGVGEDKIIDHINHNGLDNRRANLRAATAIQNSWNKRKQRGRYSSQYKGVSWDKEKGKWNARIICKGRSIFIGYYDDEKEAAKAYNVRAMELFGEYAALNSV